MGKSTVFISYRRDDCAGYAGRLEEALERACGAGTVFRDVRDIPAGESFVDVLHSRLSNARVVLVLIGPRWGGATSDGRSRLTEEGDFVRLEVASALASNCKVIPVLLSGTNLPGNDELPEPLRPLRRRQTLGLNEASWDADVDRLIRALGVPTVRRKRLLIAGAAVVALAAGSVVTYLNRPLPPPTPPDPAVETASKLIGTWRARVRYGWGDEYDESFVIERFAGGLTGTASFLKYPRGIEDLTVEGDHFSFVTRSIQSMNEVDKQLTHRYSGEFDGAQLRMRMHSTGGFDSYAPYEFTAQRSAQPTTDSEAGGSE